MPGNSNDKSLIQLIKDNPIQSVLAVLFIWFLILIWMTGSSTDSNANVLVFPDKSDAKNYQLEAVVTKTDSIRNPFQIVTEYTIDSFTWPNGGYADFTDCNVSEINSTVDCTSKSNESYSMEISEFSADEVDSYDY